MIWKYLTTWSPNIFISTPQYQPRPTWCCTDLKGKINMYIWLWAPNNYNKIINDAPQYNWQIHIGKINIGLQKSLGIIDLRRVIVILGDCPGFTCLNRGSFPGGHCPKNSSFELFQIHNAFNIHSTKGRISSHHNSYMYWKCYKWLKP